jgi:hypothetical protein
MKQAQKGGLCMRHGATTKTTTAAAAAEQDDNVDAVLV